MKTVTDLSVTSRPLRGRVSPAGASPATIFSGGARGAWHSATKPESIFIDTAGAVTALPGSGIARIDDSGPDGRVALQPSTALRPLLGRAPVGAAPGGPLDQGSGPAFIRFDGSDDVLPTVFPDGITGDLFFATRSGMAAYGISIPPAGSLTIGPYLPGDDVVGWLAVDRSISAAELTALKLYYAERGGGEDFGSIANFAAFWRDWTFITALPVIDTSAGTDFRGAWRNCSSLASFPLLDVSKGTTFIGAWRDCSSLTSFPQLDVSKGGNFQRAWNGCCALTDFPALIFDEPDNDFRWAWQNCASLTEFPPNMFDRITASTRFNGAFSGTNLSQQSIDNILVSINSTGTSNGTFNQSGGAAPSATGEAAIDAMRSRGWAVTVTGGY